jgi:hypothetical protein
VVDEARRPTGVASLKLRMNITLDLFVHSLPRLAFVDLSVSIADHTRPSTMTTPLSTIGVYRRFPKELFRLNKGPQIRLREYKFRQGKSFDVLANASGNVEPRALNPNTYEGKSDAAFLPFGVLKRTNPAPNGASMRPNSRAMHFITERFVSSQTIIYSVPQGVSRPFFVELDTL